MLMLLQALALSAQVLMTVSARFGLGNHEGLLSDADIVQTNFWSWMAQVLAILAMAVGRIAVIAFLITLQARTNVTGRWVLYLVGAAQGLINLGEVVLILRQCDPIQKLWDHNVPGTCDLVLVCSQVGFAQGSKSTRTAQFKTVQSELIMLRYRCGSRRLSCLLSHIHNRITPAHEAQFKDWPLPHHGRRRDVGIYDPNFSLRELTLGCRAGVAGINKTVAIATITQTQDITYAIAKLNTWVLTEMWFIIIFGSIPVLRPFFVRFSQSIKGTTGSARSRDRTGRSTKTSRSREQDDSWMQLYDRPAAFRVCRDPSVTSRETDDHAGTGDEQCLTNRGSGGVIVVTKDVSVVSERCP